MSKLPPTGATVWPDRIANRKEIMMFKIKVGLKSFQTHSMQKCKHQIGQIAEDLRKSSASLQSKLVSPFEPQAGSVEEGVFSPFLHKKKEKKKSATPATSNLLLFDKKTFLQKKTSQMQQEEGESRTRCEGAHSSHQTKMGLPSGFPFIRKSHPFFLTKSKRLRPTRRSHLNLPPIKKRLQSSAFLESSFIVERGTASFQTPKKERSILAQEARLKVGAFSKQKISRARMSPSYVQYPLDLEWRSHQINSQRVVSPILLEKVYKAHLLCKKCRKASIPSRESLSFLQSQMQPGGPADFVSSQTMETLLNRKRNQTQKKKSTTAKGFYGILPLPTFAREITILRSPHIDKKSREQFEWERKKARVDLHLNSRAEVSLALFILIHSRFPGVEVEIGVESKTYFA